MILPQVSAQMMLDDGYSVEAREGDEYAVLRIRDARGHTAITLYERDADGIRELVDRITAAVARDLPQEGAQATATAGAAGGAGELASVGPAPLPPKDAA